MARSIKHAIIISVCIQEKILPLPGNKILPYITSFNGTYLLLLSNFAGIINCSYD